MTNRTDNFNRADSASSLGTPSDGGSAWVAYNGTWGISSNQGYLAVTAGDDQNSAALESSVSDVDVQATLTVVTAGTTLSAIGLVARLADNNNYLIASCGLESGGSPLNNIAVYKRVAGSFTQLGSTASHTWANGDVVKLSVSSSSVTAFINGSAAVGPVTDSAGSTNTQHGLYNFRDTAPRLDDFSITGTGGATFNPGWASGATRTIGVGVF